MKKAILLFGMIFLTVAAFSATVNITNSGFTFSPATVTINQGDDVNFQLGGIHNAVEVSKATFDANGNTALPGGFSVELGGGTVTADKLTVGTHYYVCAPHASLGMKGTITVLNTTGIAQFEAKDGISVYPNPSSGNFQLRINNSKLNKEFDLEIFNVVGAKVYSKPEPAQQHIFNIEAADLPKGTYILKVNNGETAYFRKIVIR
ncbi:MAG: T9SS type A sorting domain-containing protein [Bacteroidales bacterium]